MKTSTLYRPVGFKEMQLIAECNFSGFPPRLEWQPIFYPVTNKEYAFEIVNKWNINDAFSSFCGFVTEFDVYETFLSNYPIENVGGFQHNEYWIPAEDLHLFNENISGKIRVIAFSKGKDFVVPKSQHILYNVIQSF